MEDPKEYIGVLLEYLNGIKLMPEALEQTLIDSFQMQEIEKGSVLLK